MQFLLLGLFAAASFSATPDHVEFELAAAPHSGIYLTEDERSAARARMETELWAGDIGASLIKSADQVLNADFDMPKVGVSEKPGGTLTTSSNRNSL